MTGGKRAYDLMTLRDHHAHLKHEPFDNDEPAVADVRTRDEFSMEPEAGDARGNTVCAGYWPDAETGGQGGARTDEYKPQAAVPTGRFGGYSWGIPAFIKAPSVSSGTDTPQDDPTGTTERPITQPGIVGEGQLAAKINTRPRASAKPPGIKTVVDGSLIKTGFNETIQPIRNMDLDRDELYLEFKLVDDDRFRPCLPSRAVETPENPSGPKTNDEKASDSERPTTQGPSATIVRIDPSSGGGIGTQPKPRVQTVPKPQSGIKDPAKPKIQTTVDSKIRGQFDLHNDPYQGRSLSSPLPSDWGVIRISGTEKGEQHPLVFPAFQNILMVDHKTQKSPSLTFSTRIGEMENSGGEYGIDNTLISTTSSFLGIKRTGDGSCGVALTFGVVPAGGIGGIGGGFFSSDGWLGGGGGGSSSENEETLEEEEDLASTNGTLPPQLQQVKGTGGFDAPIYTTPRGEESGPDGGSGEEEKIVQKVGLGHLGETYGGIVSSGAGIADKHLMAVNNDGEPQCPAHLQLRAPWILDNNAELDGPPEIDETPYKRAQSVGAWSEVKCRFDPAPSHPSVVGDRNGKYRWETKVPFLVPFEDFFPPNPKGGTRVTPPKTKPLPPTEVDGISDKRYMYTFLQSWMEFSAPTFTGRPFIDDIAGRDIRHTGNPTDEQLARDLIYAPVSFRFEAFGARTDADWCYTRKACQGHRTAAPTVNGGGVFKQPERSIDGASESGASSTTYIAFDGVTVAHGTPIPKGVSGSNKGGIRDGYSTTLVDGALCTDEHDSDGNKNSSMCLKPGGIIDVTGDLQINGISVAGGASGYTKYGSIVSDGIFAATIETVIGSANIPANAMTVGKRFRIRAEGFASNNSPSLVSREFRFRVGGLAGQLLTDVVGLPFQVGVTDGGWYLEQEFVVRSTGLAGDLKPGNPSSWFKTSIATTLNCSKTEADRTVSIDTTAAQDVVITHKQSTTVAAAQVTITNFVVEAI